MAVQRLFGTNGIRGDAQQLFTNQFCFDIGRTFSLFLSSKLVEKKSLAFGMDPRSSSLRIKKAVAYGISSQWEILDEGIVPTPALNYFTKKKECAGIMITGSHIEENLNGLKFFVGEEEITKADETTIENIYAQEKERVFYQEKEGKIFQEDKAKKLYIEMLVGLAQGPFSDFKVIIDAGNGTQSEIIPNVLGKLGTKVIKINCDLNRPMFSADTETENAFPKLKQKVSVEKANLGIGCDSDGDRAIFISETGEGLAGEYSCSIIAKHSPGETIVTPINTSSIVEHLGKKVARTKVGVLYVVEAMKKAGSLVGFESNGGFISGEIFYGRDAGTATIKMLNILKQTGKKLSELTAELPKFFIIKEKTDCPRESNDKIFAEVRRVYGNQKIEDLDGFKVWLDGDSWILFRPSGNAPEFRVFAEAKEKSRAKSLAEEGMNLVKAIIRKGN